MNLCLCVVEDCHGHDDRIDVLVHGQRHTLNLLRDIQRQLATEGTIMSEVDDRLAQLTTEVGAAATAITTAASDVDRALTDLKNALSGSLTDAQRAAFDAMDSSVSGLKNSVAAIQAAVDAGDPPPAPPAGP